MPNDAYYISNYYILEPQNGEAEFEIDAKKANGALKERGMGFRIAVNEDGAPYIVDNEWNFTPDCAKEQNALVEALAESVTSGEIYVEFSGDALYGSRQIYISRNAVVELDDKNVPIATKAMMEKFSNSHLLLAKKRYEKMLETIKLAQLFNQECAAIRRYNMVVSGFAKASFDIPLWRLDPFLDGDSAYVRANVEMGIDENTVDFIGATVSYGDKTVDLGERAEELFLETVEEELKDALSREDSYKALRVVENALKERFVLEKIKPVVKRGVSARKSPRSANAVRPN